MDDTHHRPPESVRPSRLKGTPFRNLTWERESLRSVSVNEAQGEAGCRNRNHTLRWSAEETVS